MCRRVYEKDAYRGTGTRSGDVLMASLEKNSCVSVWNSSSVQRKEDEEEDEEEGVVVIRRVEWMAAQQLTSSNPVAGCLFVLLGALSSRLSVFPP